MTDRLHHFTPDTNDTADLRRAFGRFATGVTIVTVQTPRGPLGMTANSFSSVSLDPPLVLWSPGKSSKRHDAFVTAAHFAVHILGAGQHPLADHFAANGEGFDQVEWSVGPNGAPTLAGCLATFYCDTFAVHPAGDHSVILGQVTQGAYDADLNAPAMLFEQSRFGVFSPDKPLT
ncbi:flavin reductase family protein [Sulfitobacter marinus]|nr:flavin reductase family protein [Sulfitobacter marinus]